MRIAAFALAFLVPALAAAQSRYAIIVTYPNDPTHEAQAARVTTALHARGIDAVTTCSAGCSMSVDVARYTEALQITNGVVAAGHLDLAVVVPGTS